MPASIKLQLVLGADIASRTIAWFTQGSYSHVDAVVPAGGLAIAPDCTVVEGWLLGARNDSVGGEPPGVQFRPPGYKAWARRTVIEVPCTNIQERRYWTFLIAQLGKPYDSEAIWAFVFNRDWRETDSWICSELQAAAGEAALILPKLEAPCNKIAPVPLALVMSAVGGKVIEDVTAMPRFF